MTTRSVAAIGAVSGALYGATYALQRSIAPIHDHGPGLEWLMALYIAVTISLFALYGLIVRLASDDAACEQGTRTLALVWPIVFNIALLGGQPSLSIDAFSYAAHGYQARSGENPYAVPVKAIAQTPYGAELARRGWIPVHGVSPYGPVWTGVEALVGQAVPDPGTAVRLIKIVVVAFSLGCGYLVWLILGDVAPRWRMRGTLLYLWNPVVVVEFAGEGHNDALMIFFLLLSVFLVIRARAATSLVAAALAGLVKVTALMLLPVQIVYAWRMRRDRRHLVAALLGGACAAVAVVLFMYAPFWIGPATLDGLRTHGRPSILASTPGVFYWYLTRTHSEAASALLLSVLMAGLFAGYLAVTSLKVRDAASLVRACGRIAVVYLLVAPGYWPWYAAMPVALLALSPDQTFTRAIVAVSLASRMAAPIDALRLDGMMDWEAQVFRVTILGVWLPAAAIVVMGAWQRRAVVKNVGAMFTAWRGARPSYDQP